MLFGNVGDLNVLESSFGLLFKVNWSAKLSYTRDISVMMLNAVVVMAVLKMCCMCYRTVWQLGRSGLLKIGRNKLVHERSSISVISMARDITTRQRKCKRWMKCLLLFDEWVAHEWLTQPNPSMVTVKQLPYTLVYGSLDGIWFWINFPNRCL